MQMENGYISEAPTMTKPKAAAYGARIGNELLRQLHSEHPVAKALGGTAQVFYDFIALDLGGAVAPSCPARVVH